MRSYHQTKKRRCLQLKKNLSFTPNRESQFLQEDMNAQLISQRNESALLVQVQRCRFRIQRIEAEAHILRAIVEKTAVQNVFWAEVVLQAEKIISGPLGGRVGVIGQLSD